MEFIKPYSERNISECSDVVSSARTTSQAEGDQYMSQAILYFDSRPLMREPIARWLAVKFPDYQVLATDREEEVAWLGQANADLSLVLLQLDSIRQSEEELTKRLEVFTRSITMSPVAILVDSYDHETVMTALACGIRGIIPTSMAGSAAIEVIRLLCAGGTYAPAASLVSGTGTQRRRPDSFGEKVLPLELRPHGDLSQREIHPTGQAVSEVAHVARVTGASAGEDSQATFLEDFTPRQLEILNCLRRGLANKMIAYELQMCESTVKIHVRNIMKKLRATNRTQVVSMTWQLFDTIQ